MRQILVSVVLCALLTFSAQATEKLPKNLIPLPVVGQTTNYSCGAAALLSVLMYWGLYSKPEETLWNTLRTSAAEGTSPMGILAGAHSFGLQTRLSLQTSIETLRKMTAKGIPAIVGFQAWREPEDENTPWRDLWHSGHYAVVAGVDDEFVYLQDPSLYNVTKVMGYGKIPIAEFMDRWHDEDSFDLTHPEISTRHHGLALFLWIPNGTPRTTLSCAKALEPIR